ncbi:MAG: hypothetical protein F4164_04680 [Gemmatimonadales bacterium]|nr:hypothetical protein [Gemmatimonadales bacterium]MYG48665.1 hypothetical protein [Gemmatimonadales bacterium]MYK02522.1 hypothetical protein [Candidatus Palauibacter ramosifaciens]
MSGVRLSDVVSVRGRFHRSVNLPGDWRGDTDLSDYVATPTIRDLAGRIVAELEDPRGTRSWSITGPYGTGKSAFALFLADLLAAEFPSHHAAEEIIESVAVPVERFVPVLLVAERKPLGAALRRALAEALDEVSPALAQQVRSSRASSGAALGRLFVEVAESVREAGRGGLLLVVDELGKFLEFAAVDPDGGDVFVLQQIAEACERSETPIIFVTILHSGFADYLRVGDELRRSEWQKIQGRFSDVPFHLPAEQMVALVAHALTKNAPPALARAWNHEIESTLESKALADATRRVPPELLHECAPLHPVTTLLLWPLFRSKVAQNERSLFAFLAAAEPFGLQHFLGGSSWDGGDPPFLRPSQLHDYIPQALGLAAFAGDHGRSWSLIDDALVKIPGDAPAQCQDVLKTVGLLSMYGAGVGLSASKETVDLAIGCDSTDALAVLEDRSIIVYRKHLGGYGLWDGSDVDLDAAFAAAREHVDSGDIVERLRRSLTLQPVVARRHYAETGTLRFLDVTVASANARDVERKLRGPVDADGRVVYAIPGPTEKMGDVVGRLTELTAAGKLRIVAIPRAFKGIETALREVECWSWVSRNVPELQGDRAARREVQARHLAAIKALEDLAGRLFPLAGSSFRPAECVWVADGEVHDLDSARGFHRWISRRCEEAFPSAPTLHNELLNRRHLSSAAAAARRNLLERMVERSHEERLGIEGTPPEASMYEAMLRRGGFHRTRGKTWCLGRPADEWRPAWDAGLEFVRRTAGARRPLAELLDLLAEPPYGLRSGPISIVLGALLVAKRDEVALYEEGVFVPELRIEVIERLVRRPDMFELQSHRLDTEQAAALTALRDVLGGKEVQAGPVDASDLLPVVKSLIVFVSRLEPYARKTRRLDPAEAVEVRDRLLAARDPHTVLFEELPEALGVKLADEGGAEHFANRLRKSLRGLRRAYPELLDGIERQLRRAFGLRGAALEARQKLALRAAPLIEFALDGRLGLFVREAAADHADRDWRETLGRVLQGGLPPSHWSDRDVTELRVRLREVSGEFARLEELAASRKNGAVKRVLRIGVLDGSYDERRAVITFDDATTPGALELATHVNEALRANGGKDSPRLRLAALAHVAAGLLEDDDGGEAEDGT